MICCFFAGGKAAAEARETEEEERRAAEVGHELIDTLQRMLPRGASSTFLVDLFKEKVAAPQEMATFKQLLKQVM